MDRVLIVDDDEGVRVVIGKHLSDAGYSVFFASNGWEGLLSLDKEGADLIILDAIMPGMDGATFIRILRNDVRRMEMPVIVISAYSHQDVREKIGDHLLQHFLGKGEAKFYDKLLELVGAILARKWPKKSN